MAATPYDVTPAETLGTGAERRPRTLTIRVGRFGGMLGLGIVAVGLLVIGIGWNGMAGSGGQVNHVSDLRAQLPWLLSGGFLGLGLMVVGAAVLVVQSAREDRARLERKLDEVVQALGGSAAAPAVPAVLSGVVRPAATGTVRAQAVPGAAESGLVVAGAASYHKPTCRLVDGRDEASHLTPAEAAARGLAACRVCKPATDVSAAPAAAATSNGTVV